MTARGSGGHAQAIVSCIECNDCWGIQDIPLGSAGSGAQAGAYLRFQEGISALKETLRKDHVLHIRLFHLTWKSVSIKVASAVQVLQ